MGLEIVEVFMGYEEQFDLDIPDEDAMELLTVGQTHRYLCKRLLAARHRRCETQQSFYQVRRTLMRISAVPRWYIRPRTRLNLTLPAAPALRRRAIRRLRAETGVKLEWDPAESVSVASLVRLSVAQAQAHRSHTSNIPPGGWTEETIWQEMKKVIVKQAEIKDAQIQYDTRYIEDLDLG